MGPMGASRAKHRGLRAAVDPMGTDSMGHRQGHKLGDDVVCAWDPDCELGQERRGPVPRNPQTLRMDAETAELTRPVVRGGWKAEPLWEEE